MKTKTWYCDICGIVFEYTTKGKVEAGFGICNECYEQQRSEGEGA